MHPKILRDTTKWLADKHEKYTKYMTQVVTHIIEGYIIHKQLKDIEILDTAKADNRIPYAPLLYPDKANTKHLVTTTHLGHYRGHVSNDNNAIHMQAFIEDMLVQEQQADMRCITWLEIYILYRPRGHKQPIDKPHNIAMAKPTFDKQFC